MESNNSNGPPPQPPADRNGDTLALPIPVHTDELFKHTASPHILNFLAANPDVNVSIRQLSRVTPVTERSTREAVDALEASGLVETFHEGNARRVHINRAALQKSDDPIQSIPQTDFRTPVRVARHYIADELEDVLGIVLFGSVARGTADRQSDIDLWILVDGELLEQRNRATKLARDLGKLKIPATIAIEGASERGFDERWDEIRDRLDSDSDAWPSAGRFSFEFVVETPQSILEQSTRVDPDRLFGEGITLHSTETFDRVVREVIGGE